MFNYVKPSLFVNKSTLTKNQERYLLNQSMDYFSEFISGQDTRQAVLQAFTGSGKTHAIINNILPEFVKTYANAGKNVIIYMAPLCEVVDASYRKTQEVLDHKIIDGKTVRVYGGNKLKSLIAAEGGFDKNTVYVFFVTAQFFYKRYRSFRDLAGISMIVCDEAHLMFGCPHSSTTKADKGVHKEDFDPKTFNKLDEMSKNGSPVLFLTATPTNSQRGENDKGSSVYRYMDPMPKDRQTTPFYQVVSYEDNEASLFLGIKHLDDSWNEIKALIERISQDTWNKAAGDNKHHFRPMAPAMLGKVGRRGAVNGLPFDDYRSQIGRECLRRGITLFVSTSDEKSYRGSKVKSMDEGIERALKEESEPLLILTIESGSAGVDLPRLKTVAVARDPSTPIHNNWSQAAGRAGRMMFGFRTHEQAAQFIKSLRISAEQKRLLAEYYIAHSVATVCVPETSALLNGDVQDFVLDNVYSPAEGAQYIMDEVFGTNGLHRRESELTVVNSLSIENNGYQQYKKDHCEACEVQPNGRTACFNTQMATSGKNEDDLQTTWPKVLQIHHKDGDHYNNDESNLITVCPNYHAYITIEEEHYNNRYDGLRQTVIRTLDNQ